MKEPRDLGRHRLHEPRLTERSLFPTELFRCAFCGGFDSEDNPLTLSTWGLPFVSDPFPAHRFCAEDYGYDRVTEAEMQADLR